MKLFRRWYWIISGFLRKYALGILLGLVIGSALVLNYAKLVTWLPTTTTTVIGRVGTITSQTIPLDIQLQLSRGLTRFKEDGQVELDAALSITMDTTGTEYKVVLDPQYTFSNQTPLTTESLEVAIQDVEIEALNETTLVFRLQEPYAPFPTLLTQPILLKVPPRLPFQKTHIIGLKEFRLTTIETKQDRVTLIKLQSSEDTIIYKFYPTEDEAILAFKLGQVDQIDNLSAPALEDWPNTELSQQSHPNRYTALFFNTADPNLQDKTIRQMLTYATPKTSDDNRVISPIASTSWAYNPQVKPYEFSQETASSMYERMLAANPNFSLSIELTTTPSYAQEGQRIVDSWNQIGVQASLTIVSFPDTNDYQVLLIGQQIPQDPDQYALWHSTQSTNITRYQNPKIDKLLEDGRQEIDEDKRKLLYQEFQRFLVEDCPSAFLSSLSTYTLKRI